MPKTKWSGYHRFCPLARALDLVGERWTLVIVHDLLARPARYTDLLRRLPGIGSSALADRLRKLERAGLLVRTPGGVGEPVVYTPTEAARALHPTLAALRAWGVAYLAAPDDEEEHRFDVRLVEGFEALPTEEYEWTVGERVTSLRHHDGELVQSPGPADDPVLRLRTSEGFMRRWAAGDVSWDEGRGAGEVEVEGDEAAWPRMLAATGYLRRYEPDA